MKQKKSKATSEKPTADDVGTAYSLGAIRADNEPLTESDNRSTAHNDREEAHRQALQSEADHYCNNHPDYKPRVEVFEVPPQTKRQPTRSYRDTQVEMSTILAERRKSK